MNIGIFTDSYYPIINGVVSSIRLLENELIEQGHNVYIFTTTVPNYKEKKPYVFRMPSVSFILCKPHRVAAFHSFKLVKIIKILNLDVIHSHTEFSIGNFGHRIARKLNLPIIHTYHTMWKDYIHYVSKGKVMKNFTTDFVKHYSRKFCNKCNAVITPSSKVYDLLKNDYNVNSDCIIVPTGIDLSKFNSSNVSSKELNNFKNKLGINFDDKVILFVGRLAKEKNIAAIIKQMPALLKIKPNIKLLIVGEGPYRNDLENLVSKLNLQDKVLLPGEFIWEEINKIYKLANIYITASETETQGLTIIEAMASGLPVIARNDRNIEGIIKDDYNGKTFSYDNEIPLKVIDIINNPLKSNFYINNSKNTVEEFSSKKYGENIEKIYSKVIKEHIYNQKINAQIQNIQKL